MHWNNGGQYFCFNKFCLISDDAPPLGLLLVFRSLELVESIILRVLSKEELLMNHQLILIGLFQCIAPLIQMNTEWWNGPMSGAGQIWKPWDFLLGELHEPLKGPSAVPLCRVAIQLAKHPTENPTQNTTESKILERERV